jgi:hypothetical protein
VEKIGVDTVELAAEVNVVVCAKLAVCASQDNWSVWRAVTLMVKA